MDAASTHRQKTMMRKQGEFVENSELIGELLTPMQSTSPVDADTEAVIRAACRKSLFNADFVTTTRDLNTLRGACPQKNRRQCALTHHIDTTVPAT